VVAVVSPHLVAVDAAWDDGPDAGRWIADRLGPFGPSVGHAVPLGYPAYAVVPIPPDAGRHPRRRRLTLSNHDRVSRIQGFRLDVAPASGVIERRMRTKPR